MWISINLENMIRLMNSLKQGNNATRSTENVMENLTKQFEVQETLPIQELQGLDRQLRSIRVSLKVEMAKKIELQQCIKREKCKLKEI